MRKRNLFLLTGTVILGLCACSGAGKKDESEAEPVENIISDGGEIMQPTAPAGIKIAEIDENGNVKGATNGAVKLRISEDAVSIHVIHSSNAEQDEWTVESEDIDYLRDWLTGLEYELVTFEDEAYPSDSEAVESYVFETDDGGSFIYSVYAPDKVYLQQDDVWFRVKNPSDPPIMVTEVDRSSEYPDGTATASEEIVDGVSMYVGSVKDGAVSLVFSNGTDRDVYTTADFHLFRKTAEGFEEVEPLTDEGFRPDDEVILQSDSSADYVQEYDRMYEELPYGEYRIAKTIKDDDKEYMYFADFVVGDMSYGVDYGHSFLYTQEEMTAAVLEILQNFQPSIERGCEIHNIRYASDDSNNEKNLDRLNELAAEGTVYTQCAEFLMDFHSPKTDAGAWNVDEEYTDWQWWLARTDGGDWECLSYGY